MHYLIHGANSIGESIKYIEGGITYDPKFIRLCLSAACDTLALLHDDDMIAEDVHNSTHSKEVSEAMKHYFIFSEEFLALDKALLISSGMNARVANYLFRDFERLQGIITIPEGIDYQKFKNIVYDLKTLACEDMDKESEEGKRNILTRSLLVTGGAAVITTNHLADIIAPMLAEISKTLGGSMVGKGWLG